jgi:glutathione S-transferase
MMEVVHHRVVGGTVDDAMQARCGRAFTQAANTLIDRMAGRTWLVGDRMSAADVTAAAVLYRIRRAGLFDLPPETQNIDPWVDRIMAFDRTLDRR